VIVTGVVIRRSENFFGFVMLLQAALRHVIRQKIAAAYGPENGASKKDVF
jgi:hypothetical protein